MFTRRVTALITGLACAGVLAACGDGGGDGADGSSAAPSPDATGTSPATSGATSAAPTDTAEAVDDAHLAASTLAVGVTGFDDAAAAVDLGVRHLFIGSDTDLTMLNGQGDPARSIDALRERAGGRLTVSVDEEGGQVQRLAGIIGELPSARQMAATMQPDDVTALFAEHGRKMHDLGFTMDFAPDVDLDGGQNVSDNAIGDRAFSADPATVVRYGGAAVEGLKQAGITPVIKHFPGHGHATGDSHAGTVSTPPIDQMGPDIQPFSELSQIDGVAVMVGHMQVPGLDTDDGAVQGASTPSSLNPAAYGLLRAGADGAPGFTGTVYTDDLTGMQAITDLHSGPEAVVAALQAGADAPLTSTAADVQGSVDAIVAALADGSLDRGAVGKAAERAAGADAAPAP
jgi:beta-N-acetylhexosaminidase